jgi:quercetin dioxygenase-like cupin family protein
MSLTTHHDIPNPAAFVEMPGMRGIRVARVASSDGRSLEYIEATKDVVLPAMTHPSKEEGRVLSGKILFMQEGHSRTLSSGDTWTVEAGQHQGPHVVLEDALVAVFHHGKSAFDA